ncbi:50S ribosome-binding GTPase [soil metagenome]
MLSKFKLLTLFLLVIAPFVFLAGVGSVHLWNTGWTFTAWWPMAGCLTLAYALAWYWTRKRSKLLPKTDHVEPPEYWTDRDKAAWSIVEREVDASGTPTMAQLSDAHHYTTVAMSLSMQIAQHYNPSAKDPFSHLTLPEILTCGELVTRDLSRKVNEYIPGSHLLTIQQWKQARQAVDWGQKAWNVSWIGRAILDPVRASTQFLASKAGGSVLTQVQNNVLAWFHTAYLHELGRHLIELNSGRLRVGAKRYRELLDAKEPLPTPATGPLQIAVVGQVKAGKSSLINAVLGEQKAAVDIVPLTNSVTKYELKTEGKPELLLLDTPGYGITGPNDAEFTAAFEAAQTADLLLFVLHARTAARSADVAFQKRLHDAFASQPQLRKPMMIGVATHVDLLTPAAEWSPPYDLAGSRPKEASMRDALAAITESLGAMPLVPVVALESRMFNVNECLLPAMAAHLDGAKGVQLLRVLHVEGRAGAAKKTLEQVLNLGRESLKVLWQSAKSR